MPLLNITADTDGLGLADGGATDPALRAALEADPGPVTVMVHGFRYLPSHPRHCPHDSLFAVKPRLTGPRIVSWPRRLGLRGRQGEGIGIGFGWPARGGVRAVHARAGAMGRPLAALVAQLAHLAPGRPVRLIGHSMGARVCLSAIARSAPGAVSRAILLAPADYDSAARAALDTPGGRGVEVLHVSSRENDLFDAVMERLIPASCPGDRMLGFDCPNLPGMATLQLDHAPSLSALRQAGFPIAAPARRICHWSPYTRPGVFPLYRAFLDGDLTLGTLGLLLPHLTSPRWARFGAGLPRPMHPVARASGVV